MKHKMELDWGARILFPDLQNRTAEGAPTFGDLPLLEIDDVDLLILTNFLKTHTHSEEEP